MLALALALAAAPLPAGTVVLGLSTVDGTRTEVVALTPAGERRALSTVTHLAGHLPRGVLRQDSVVLVSAVDDAAGATVEEVRLGDGARRVLATGALRGVPPTVDEAGEVLFVRAGKTPTLEVVRARDGAVRARVEASWLHPARGHAGAFLVVERRGGARLAAVANGALQTLATLGKVSARSPAMTPRRWLVEERLPDGRAHVVEVGTGKLVREGLAGMDPLPLDGDTLAFGAGTKAAAIIVDGARSRQLSAPQSGVAHPLAGALVGDVAHVVAWLDRGASLPGELWRFTDGGAVRLLEPASGLAVEVYGVVAP